MKTFFKDKNGTGVDVTKRDCKCKQQLASMRVNSSTSIYHIHHVTVIFHVFMIVNLNTNESRLYMLLGSSAWLHPIPVSLYNVSLRNTHTRGIALLRDVRNFTDNAANTLEYFTTIFMFCFFFLIEVHLYNTYMFVCVLHFFYQSVKKPGLIENVICVETIGPKDLGWKYK